MSLDASFHILAWMVPDVLDINVNPSYSSTATWRSQADPVCTRC